MTDRPEPVRPREMWWTVFTIVLGSIVLGTLLPVFLVVAALGTLLIPFLAIREQRTLRRARRELIEQREVLDHEKRLSQLRRSVIDAADIPIVVTDVDGVVSKANARAGAVLGVRPAMIGRRNKPNQ